MDWVEVVLIQGADQIKFRVRDSLAWVVASAEGAGLGDVAARDTADSKRQPGQKSPCGSDGMAASCNTKCWTLLREMMAWPKVL